VTPPQSPIDDVVIRFTRESHYQDQVVYHAEVRESPILLRGGAFQADIEARLEAFRQLYANRLMDEPGDDHRPDDADPQTTAAVRDLGVQLYELLPDALREAFPRVLQHAFDKGRGIRLVFEARAGDRADRLLSMPWEIAYFNKLNRHLGLMPRVIITRRLLETVRQGAPLVTAPFRIAHVVAQPKQYGKIPPEIWEAERDAIHQAAQQDDFYTFIAHPGSVQRLQEALSVRNHQVVHFLGHGEVAADATNRGYLLFADESGRAQAVSGERLLNLLSTTSSVQLVVLNSCHGASVSAGGAIAMQLVYGGVPFVVAMQDEIRLDAAVTFAKTFYGAVQRGVAVEHALALTRLKIAADLPGSHDWSLPTLYTSLGAPMEGRIASVGSRIERWLHQPEGQRQLGAISLGFGGVHLLVALLLALSGSFPPPPALAQAIRVTVAMAPWPPLLAMAARLFGRLPLPAESGWSASVQAGLLLRMFGASALGLGLPAFCAWLLWLLLAALHFWTALAPAAQILLLALMFAPGVLVGWQLAIGHGIGFIVGARVATPRLDWTDSIVVVAGYTILCGPLALLWLAPEAVAPPRGNIYVGVILIALGYLVRRQAADRPAPLR
jgi:hypothetical protein